jgi:signal transduction histidine kinase
MTESSTSRPLTGSRSTSGLVAAPAASILIVDDRPENLLALEAILEPLGQRIVRASSGELALRRCLEEDFAVILLDMRMPGMSGLETAAFVKARERSRHVPILFLTAHDDTDDALASAYQLGAVDFLRKPLNPDIIRAKVRVFVELFLRGERIEAQERALEVERRFLRALLESVQTAIVACDAAGAVTVHNRAARALFRVPDGAPAAAWKQSLDLRDGVGRELPASGGPLARALAGERFENDELVVSVQGEPQRTVVATGCPIVDKGGQTLGAVVSLHDVTERRQAAAMIASKAEALERSNTELERFAYVASHDLQEPLRMVSSYTQLLGRRYKGKLDADADEFIGFAVDGAARMQRLIEDLLAYSRITSRGKPFEETSCDRALDAALANLKLRIADVGADVRRGPLPTVLADPTQIEQLFQNLVGNALKFRTAERSTVVEISAVREPGAAPPSSEGREEAPLAAPVDDWHISVADNGIGIDPQYFDRIFVMFQRLHTSEQYDGTGIGLTICRRIVERHGGKIWIDSTPGKGTTIHFTLPAIG